MDIKLIEAFNKQINQEFYSAYLYFAMSTYFDEIAMMGFSKFMRHKTCEKLSRAQKIYDYIILRDEKLSFSKIEEPSMDWINVTDIFSSALAHEEFILEQIKMLYDVSKQAQDYAALEFISKLLDCQVKDIGLIRKIVFRAKNANVISGNIEQLDEKITDFIQ
ncbi:MAG: ferritin [Candidatus Gastranaerophilales bacterium]|nr:ferritin [Candidatus Gastranaerophilales bacterium]